MLGGAILSRVADRMWGPSDEYLAGWTKVVNSYTGGRPEESLSLLRQLESRVVGRTAAFAHARACLLCATGRADEALEVAGGVVSAGSWWAGRKLADPDLVALDGFPDWTSLKQTMQRREAAALADAHHRAPIIRILGDEARRSATGAVVVLHMYGVDADETAGIWEGLSGDGLRVVVPQSRLLDGDGRPCWDDEELAWADLRNAVHAARRLCPESALILAGASQGARLAAGSALTGSVDCSGFIAVAGAPAVSDVAAHLSAAAESGICGHLVSGDQDFVLDTQRSFHQALCEAGIECGMTVVPDLGHVYPLDWPDLGAAVLAKLVH